MPGLHNTDYDTHYHDNNRTDPLVDDDQRHRMLSDTLACWQCDCAEHQDTTCRCSCHTNRRYH